MERLSLLTHLNFIHLRLAVLAVQLPRMGLRLINKQVGAATDPTRFQWYELTAENVAVICLWEGQICFTDLVNGGESAHAGLLAGVFQTISD